MNKINKTTLKKAGMVLLQFATILTTIIVVDLYFHGFHVEQMNAMKILFNTSLACGVVAVIEAAKMRLAVKAAK